MLYVRFRKDGVPVVIDNRDGSQVGYMTKGRLFWTMVSEDGRVLETGSANLGEAVAQVEKQLATR
jgi:hypothetical protein